MSSYCAGFRSIRPVHFKHHITSIRKLHLRQMDDFYLALKQCRGQQKAFEKSQKASYMMLSASDASNERVHATSWAGIPETCSVVG